MDGLWRQVAQLVDAREPLRLFVRDLDAEALGQFREALLALECVLHKVSLGHHVARLRILRLLAADVPDQHVEPATLDVYFVLTVEIEIALSISDDEGHKCMDGIAQSCDRLT